MKQETIIQILALLILAILSLFYSPLTAGFEGKIIFFGMILTTLLIFIILDIYKSIKNNNDNIRLFNEKLDIIERIKNLENFKESWEKQKEQN